MYAALLKERMEGLPKGQFVQVWECIEAIDEAINKAGPTAVLALTYVRALHEERLVQLLNMQDGRIAHLVAASVEQHTRIVQLATSRNTEIDKAAKLERRIARLTSKKKPKKRK